MKSVFEWRKWFVTFKGLSLDIKNWGGMTSRVQRKTVLVFEWLQGSPWGFTPRFTREPQQCTSISPYSTALSIIRGSRSHGTRLHTLLKGKGCLGRPTRLPCQLTISWFWVRERGWACGTSRPSHWGSSWWVASHSVSQWFRMAPLWWTRKPKSRRPLKTTTMARMGLRWQETGGLNECCWNN